MKKLSPEEMDNAADEAASELSDLAVENADSIAIVADWFKKYYMKVGHKRLGRILVKEYVSDKSIDGDEEK